MPFGIFGSKLTVFPLFIALVLLEGCGVNAPGKRDVSPMKPRPKSLAHCFGDEVQSVTAPVFPNEPTGPTYSYKFRRMKGFGRKRTVIFLPGGPGESSMDGKILDTNGIDVIFTDPRGAGCNQYNDQILPDSAIRTDYIASDILYLIRSLKLTRYAIYGSSYGTVLATVLAHQIEHSDLPSPQFVLLEGTFDRAKPGSEFGAKYAEIYRSLNIPKHVRDSLPSFEKDAKDSENQSFLGIPKNAWMIWLQATLMLGKWFDPTLGWFNAAELYFNRIDEPEILEAIRKQSQELIDALGALENRTFKLIHCREMSSSQEGARTKEVCQGVEPSLLYDSANFPISTPIYYFQGDLDPATPPENARYHFDYQPLAEKHFIRIKEAGHAPFAVHLKKCHRDIWRSLFDKDPSEKLRIVLDAKDWAEDRTRDLHHLLESTLDSALGNACSIPGNPKIEIQSGYPSSN